MSEVIQDRRAFCLTQLGRVRACLAAGRKGQTPVASSTRPGAYVQGPPGQPQTIQHAISWQSAPSSAATAAVRATTLEYLLVLAAKGTRPIVMVTIPRLKATGCTTSARVPKLDRRDEST
jgi:hypothetical protein